MVVSFTGVLVVGIVSVLVPVILGFVPALTVPGAVLEVIAGIVIGPSVLGWVHIDVAITVLADLGLGMLLFLAGLEIDVAGLRGSLGRLAGMGFAVSVVLGIGFGFALAGAGLGGRPRSKPGCGDRRLFAAQGRGGFAQPVGDAPRCALVPRSAAIRSAALDG